MSMVFSLKKKKKLVGDTYYYSYTYEISTIIIIGERNIVDFLKEYEHSTRKINTTNSALAYSLSFLGFLCQTELNNNWACVG